MKRHGIGAVGPLKAGLLDAFEEISAHWIAFNDENGARDLMSGATGRAARSRHEFRVKSIERGLCIHQAASAGLAGVRDKCCAVFCAQCVHDSGDCKQTQNHDPLLLCLLIALNNSVVKLNLHCEHSHCAMSSVQVTNLFESGCSCTTPQMAVSGPSE